MKNNFFILVLVLFLASCVKDKPETLVQPPVQLTNSKKVYIVNEGPFQNGNGSISLYDSGSNEVVENFYETQNQSQLGNIAQSLNYFNGSYYIVVNNSKKIIVCDKEFKKKTEITGLNSPRYILPITNQKAYVSDLYANSISIINLNTNAITGSIPCSGKTEKMTLLYNKAYITNTDRDHVYVVNVLSDKIEDSVFVGAGASSVALDANDQVWVLASGNYGISSGRLSKINPATNKVDFFVNFELTDSPFNLCLNAKKDTLYFLNKSVYRMSVKEMSLPASHFIASGTKNFYGLGVNPNDYSIYVSDALDYSQRSQIYIYHADGSPKHNFKAGIISNSFYFE
ncbi:YncE family protein [Aurantibacillus circumpalustris]|uniref:YncE family protein n=1 Tax=Aurantibacillus circumpalustris TaxID=3036359 RepID=UPI00295A8C87|nr:DUF5074 domain-containing protein [Aurantibacillus circumpalustris]